MLLPIIKQLNKKRIVLASGSARRQELVRNVGLGAELCPSLFEENLNPDDFPNYSDYIQETALQKVLEVSNRLSKQTVSPDIIIGADTMVLFNEQLYGKPKDKEDAFHTLSKLMGHSCTVHTAVVIKYGTDICKFIDCADVCFGEATSEQIQAYVDTGDPLDKAGSFGIQNSGATFIKAIKGDFYTVMGLPLHRLCVEITKLFNANK